jgi:hypothetical protein
MRFGDAEFVAPMGADGVVRHQLLGHLPCQGGLERSIKACAGSAGAPCSFMHASSSQGGNVGRTVRLRSVNRLRGTCRYRRPQGV